MKNYWKKSCLLLIFLMTASIVHSQITITGKVTDAENGESLPGVSVTVGKAGTFTDIFGKYTLHINHPGNSDLKIKYSCIGFSNKEVTCENIQSQTINIKLQSDQKLLSEIVVNGQPYDFGVRSPQSSAIAVTQMQIKNLPVIFGEPDLLKTLQTTPGVQSGKTGNAGIMVRGGNFDQNNLMIDGGSLYSSEHMRGFISAVNPDIISTLAFYRGAFPTKYSGRLSSVIDITGKEGDFYNYHGELSLGTALGRLNVSGPIIKGTTSFAVAARMSYFGLIYQKAVEHHYNKINQKCPYSDMEFWDVNAKITHKFSDNDRISLTFVKDHDKQNMPGRKLISNSTTTPYYLSPDGTGVASYEPVNDAVLAGFSYKNGKNQPIGDRMRWGNTLGALNWNHRWDGSEKNLHATIAFTEYDYRRSQKGMTSSEHSIKWNEQYHNLYNDSIVTSSFENSTLSNYSKVRNLRLATSMNLPLDKSNTLVYGLEYRRSWFNPGRHLTKYTEDYKNWCIADWSSGIIFVDHRDEMTVTSIDTITSNRQNLSSFNFFLNDDMEYGRFKANIGINLALYGANGKTYFYPEPRIALNYMVGKNSSIKAAATRISQAERLLSGVSLVAPNDIWVPATDSVPPMRSTQFSLSFYHQFPYGIDLSVDGYYKTTKGNIDYLEGTSFNDISTTWQQQVTIGKSRSYGVEFLLQKSSGSTNGWISYTWSRSFDKYDTPGKAISNGIEIPALADRPHNLAINLSQRWWGISGYPRNHFDVSLLFKYMSGRRVTIPDHISYAAMLQVADHYISHDTHGFSPQLTSATMLYNTVQVPSEAFDLYMRFKGYSERYNYVLPYEMTLDMNLSFTMYHRTGESKISVGVTNVLNRKNISTVYLSSFADGKSTIVGVCDFPITPSLSYTYSF